MGQCSAEATWTPGIASQCNNIIFLCCLLGTYFNPSNTHNVIVDIRGELIQALPKRKHFFVGCFLRERKRKVGEWQRGALQDSDTALERDTCERGHGCLRALTRVVLHLWGNMWWRLQPIMKCNTIVGFICWKKAPLCDGKSFSPA